MTLVAILAVAFLLGISVRMHANLVFTSFLVAAWLLLFALGDPHVALNALTPFEYPRGMIALSSAIVAMLGYLITGLLIERIGVAVLVLVVVVGTVLALTWLWPLR